MKTVFTTSAFVAGVITASMAQITDTTLAPRLTVSGYIKAYCSHDFTAPKTSSVFILI